MPSRNETARAHARLQLETPISDDANLLKLQEQVADYVREAKRRDPIPTEPNELISTVIDAVARDYFRHAIRKLATTIVSRGDSLWRLSRHTYGVGTRYAVIYKANREQIRNPNLIHPGQIFVLPAR